MGVTSIGLVVFQNHIRMNVFSWSKMVKISFKRKDFFIQLRREPVSVPFFKAYSYKYFNNMICSPRTMTHCWDSVWARTRMLRHYGNHVSNITRSFVLSVRIGHHVFYHCRWAPSSTTLDALNCRQYRRVNNVARSRRFSHDHRVKD